MEMRSGWWGLWALLLLGQGRAPAQAEVFTALADMEALLSTEGLLLDSLHAYVQRQQEALRQLQRKYDEYRVEHTTAMEDVTNYLSNPINAFKVIKRLTTDWTQVEHIMTAEHVDSYIQNFTVIKENLKFPTEEDLSGAATALVRLQDTYKLDTEDVGMGKLNGVKYSSPMTAHDCFEIGRMTYNSADFDHTEKWMNLALSKYLAELNKTVDKTEILEYLAFSSYKMGRVNTALTLTNELLELMPNHTRALGNIPHYEKAIQEKSARKEEEPSFEANSEEHRRFQERLTYEELCREEYALAESVKKDLKCRYYTESHPFLRLAPLKLEEHYLDPYIVVFHNVLSDEEIDFIKESAKPRFRRATVQDSETGQLVVAKYRISKSAWLKDPEHRIIARVSQRAADMSGLSMETAEELQVVNYGIGGHYEPHFDFARQGEAFFGSDDDLKASMGNRIATVLFYMSDVAQGGATVFPELGLSVKPRKGSGVFWMNLHASGMGNLATRHAACPVLQGSKWVSNKWIHQGGQEFIKPCNLEFQEEGMSREFPKPVRKGISLR